jgi:hypothetical protein
LILTRAPLTASSGLAKLAFAVGFLALGCATDLSTLQTAKTLPPGRFAGLTSVGINTPAGTLSTIARGNAAVARLDQALQSGQPYLFTEADQANLLGSAVALAILPPSASYELTIRAGLARNWELGVRYGVNAARVDLKWHLLHWDADEAPWPMDLALGAAASHYFFNSSGLSNLGYARVDDFRRLDLELPVYVSADLSPSWSAYGAVKYLYSRTHLNGSLGGAGFNQEVPLPGLLQSHFIGMTAGTNFSLGLFHLRAYGELTFGYTALSPFLLRQKQTLGGITLFPALGIGSPL